MVKRNIRIDVVQRRDQYSEPFVNTSGSQLVNKYRVTTYIKNVVLYNLLNELDEVDPADIPMELFLLRKLNPAAGSSESVISGNFVRVAEPEDFQSSTPTVFGSEEKIWVRNPWTYPDQQKILFPSIAPSGTELTQATAVNALAPLDTKNTNGYYVSRVNIAVYSNTSDASTGAENVLTSIRTFALKYNAYLNVSFEPEEAAPWVDTTYG